jgi:hypothetical protein
MRYNENIDIYKTLRKNILLGYFELKDVAICYRMERQMDGKAQFGYIIQTKDESIRI